MLLQSIICSGVQVPVAGTADPDAIVYMDFTTATYELNQVAVLRSDLLAGVEGAAVTSRGMNCDTASGNFPVATALLISVFETLLADGFTVVFDVENLEEYDRGLMFITDAVTYDTAGEALEFWQPYRLFDWFNLGAGSATGPAEFLGQGFNRYAATVGKPDGLGNYRSAVSVNGSAITATPDEYDSVAYTQFSRIGTPGMIAFGSEASYGYYLDAAYIRRIIVYPPKTDAELVAIAAMNADPGVVTLVDHDEVVPSATTSINLTIPAGAAVGDLAVVCLSHRDTVTPPAGWTLAATQSGSYSGTTGYESIYKRTVQPGDPGAVTAWSVGSSSQFGGMMLAFNHPTRTDLDILSSNGATGAAITAIAPSAYHQIGVACITHRDAENTGLNSESPLYWTQLHTIPTRHGVEIHSLQPHETGSGTFSGISAICNISFLVG